MRGFRSADDVIDFVIREFVLRRHLSESIIKYRKGKYRMGKEF